MCVECNLLTRHAFSVFPTVMLGIFSLTIAVIHVYKYFCKRQSWCPPLKRPTYLVRALNWFVFGVALLVFPHVPTLDGRALLRTALAFMIFSELGYNLDYLAEMIKNISKYIGEKTRLG